MDGNLEVKIGQRIRAMRTDDNIRFGIAGKEGVVIRYLDCTYDGIKSKLCTIREDTGELFDCQDHSLNIIDPRFEHLLISERVTGTPFFTIKEVGWGTKWKAVDAIPMEKRKFKDGEPCNHPGCLNHVTHPCEGCGRIRGIYIHYHTCNCGEASVVPHKVGTMGCKRFMAEPPVQIGDAWIVNGDLVSWTTLTEQRGYYMFPCGCWSRWSESSNSLEDK